MQFEQLGEAEEDHIKTCWGVSSVKCLIGLTLRRRRIVNSANILRVPKYPKYPNVMFESDILPNGKVKLRVKVTYIISN